MTTKKQEQFKKWIELFIKKNNRMPRITEIQKKFKLSSPASAHERLTHFKENIEVCPCCSQKLK